MNRKAIIISGVIAGAIFGFLLYQNYDLRKQQERLLSEMRQQGGRGKEGRQEDPYRSKAVKNTILKNAQQIQVCYKTMLESKPAKTDGRVKLDWRIASSGKVILPAVIAADIENDAFKVCLAKTVSAWEFPPPPFGEEYYVEHTFSFQKENKAK